MSSTVLPTASLNVEMSVDNNADSHGDPAEGELNVEMNLGTHTEELETQELDCELSIVTGQQPKSEVVAEPNHKWQKDIEHLTNVTDKLNRTNATISLLLLNSPKSTHIDTEDKELMENALLMPVGGEKQPDIVLEMEHQTQKETGTNKINSTTISGMQMKRKMKQTVMQQLYWKHLHRVKNMLKILKLDLNWIKLRDNPLMGP